MNKMERSYKPIPIRQRIKVYDAKENSIEYDYVDFEAVHLGEYESGDTNYTLYETEERLIIHVRDLTVWGNTKKSYLRETTRQELITDPKLKMLAKEAGIIEPLTLEEALSNE